uniref:Uncharacterized protein n=1 Tax=Urocitellus parryii TaxID=9999 RepID=A0A8D2IK25_UROPR
ELKGHLCIVFLTVFLPNPVTVILDFAGRSVPPDTALDKGQGRFVYGGGLPGTVYSRWQGARGEL